MRNLTSYNLSNELCTIKEHNWSYDSTNSTSTWLYALMMQSYFSTFNRHRASVLSKTLFIEPSLSKMCKVEYDTGVKDQLKNLGFYSYKYGFGCISNSKTTATTHVSISSNHEGPWSLVIL